MLGLLLPGQKSDQPPCDRSIGACIKVQDGIVPVKKALRVQTINEFKCAEGLKMWWLSEALPRREGDLTGLQLL